MLPPPPLKPFQIQALNALRSPGHLICQAPTGSGKSRIFQEFCARTKARALLITPLISLGRQQVRQFESLGIPVTHRLGGQRQSPPFGWGVWIVSPESLATPGARGELRRFKPDFLIVDESHCLWEWGEDFRPSYAQIYALLTQHRIERGVWLSATLPREAAQAITARLTDLNYPVNQQGEFQWPERLTLRFLRVNYAQRLATLVRVLRGLEGPGILFVQSRVRTEEWQALLNRLGISNLIYHAGLSREERMIIEKKASDSANAPRVVVATSAFGLGMDLSHLRWSLIEGVPANILTLCQMLGRVGRSNAGNGILIWSDEDFNFWEKSALHTSRRIQELKLMKKFLTASGCRQQHLQTYFGSLSPAQTACGRCDRCLS